jgi:hypothetical protein
MDGILGVIALVFAIGFFVRAAVHFNTEKKQKDEMISLLTEIRDNLKKP